MDAYENLLQRRSIRKFQDQPVPQDLLDKILKAAMYAPTARSSQPWEFVIVDEKDLLEKISGFTPSVFMAKEAPVGILVCGDLEKDYKGFWAQDCAAATQNILLAAHALGLGGVWTGVYPKEDLIPLYRSMFHLPDHIMPMAFLPLGYPDQEMPQPQRMDTDRIHKNQWGK